MKYVAWYTKETVYEEICNKVLKPSLKEYGVDYHLVPMPNLKKWNMNVAQKPLVVQRAIEILKEPFVLLDVDCKLTGKPILFDEIDPEEYDIAYHTLDWSKWYNRPSDVRRELLTGTMWFNPNTEVMNLVAEWGKYCTAHNCADQIPLEHLMHTRYKHLRVFHLPLEYVWIDSLPNGDKPHVKPNGEVIIRHFQASRSAKRGEL